MISVDREVFKFINIPKNQPVKFKVKVTNNSDKSISITPWVSCSCTECVPLKGTLEPSEETHLNIVYTPSDTGLDEKTFGVNFNYKGTNYKTVTTILAKVI